MFCEAQLVLARNSFTMLADGTQVSAIKKLSPGRIRRGRRGGQIGTGEGAERIGQHIVVLNPAAVNGMLVIDAVIETYNVFAEVRGIAGS